MQTQTSTPDFVFKKWRNTNLSGGLCMGQHLGGLAACAFVCVCQGETNDSGLMDLQMDPPHTALITA